MPRAWGNLPYNRPSPRMRATECLNKGLSLATTARNKYRCPPLAPGPGLYAVAVYDGFRVNESPPQSPFFQYILVLTQPLKPGATDCKLSFDTASLAGGLGPRKICTYLYPIARPLGVLRKILRGRKMKLWPDQH